MKSKITGMAVAIVTTLLLLGCPNPVTDPPKSNKADLSDLTVSTGTLSPAFAAGTTAYSVSVPNGTTSITVTGTKADANATLSANNGVAQSLSVGANPITITVTARDGTTTKDYVVTVTRTLDYLSANIGTLKYVPAGQFQRDATASNISVITQPYRMSQHEITRQQFFDILGTDPSDTTISTDTTASTGSTTITDPVQKANWYHAIAFCNKLSLAEGLTPVYAVTGVNFTTLTYASIPTTNNATWNAATATWTNNGYRLPTEMEWMWAAMGAPADGQGGGTNTTGYLKGYAGSTEGAGQTNIVNYAWYSINSSSKTHPAGTKTANELGLYDMSGNVYEWCWDWYASYPTGTQTDYRGAAAGTGRVARGGGWGDDASYCTVAFRSGYFPYFQGSGVGFRVVRP